MKIEDVKKLKPIERFWYWIGERHAIYERRKLKRPKPWTDDEILQRYRFCNVRRMDDKVSKWLIRNWYNPNFGHANMLVACTLARQINSIDPLDALGFPTVWHPQRFIAILEERANNGLRNYSAAYMITANFGVKGRPKESKPYQTIVRVCQPIYDAVMSNVLVMNPDSMEQSHKELLSYQGFSSFIAGQVVADLRWAIPGKWSDKDSWAPIGPGSTRGMNRLLGKNISNKLTNSDLCSYIRELKERACTATVVTKSLLDKMEAIDWQNCLCEFDKYSRVLEGEGRPKQLYKGI